MILLSFRSVMQEKLKQLFEKRLVIVGLSGDVKIEVKKMELKMTRFAMQLLLWIRNKM